MEGRRRTSVGEIHWNSRTNIALPGNVLFQKESVMAGKPAPDQVRQTSRHVESPRSAAGRSRAWWIGSGIVVLILGFGYEVFPYFSDHRGTLLRCGGAVLVLALLAGLTGVA